MARIRTIKPSFFTSLTIVELTVEQRLTFIGLWTHVDDDGRCIADARLIKGAIWPLDSRTADDIREDLRALTECSLIAHYEAGGRPYLQVCGWAEHQRISRPTRSALPSPDHPTARPLTCGNEDSLSTCGAFSEGSAQEGKGREGKGKEGKDLSSYELERDDEAAGDGVASRKRSTRATRIPDGWTPAAEQKLQTDAVTAGVDLHRELDRFRDYWRAKGGGQARKADWQATWRNWLRKACDDAPRGREGPSHGDRYAAAAEARRREETL